MDDIKAKEISIIDIDRIVPNPKNNNKHNPEQLKQLVKIIKVQGFRSPLTISNRSGFLAAGHLRLDAARKLGYTKLPVIFQDFESEAEEYAHLTADNAIAAQSSLDLSMVNLAMLDFGPDFDLDLLGIKDFVIEPIEKFEPQGDADNVPELRPDPVSKKGDVWLCGHHRVMCGDSTMFDDVKKLMGDAQADMIFTDPPWNVNYGAVEKGNPMGYKERTIKNDHMDADKWKEFIDGFCAQLFAFSKPGCPIYLVMSAQEWPQIDRALREVGFHWSSTIIWTKDRLVLSRKDYHTQYEPIWYGWNESAARLHPVEDRKQTDLWQVNRPSVSELHPTTKPVELIERALTNSCSRKGIVLDLFGGSGSTMIACQNQGIACRSMELDEKYCDVIVSRYIKFTGFEAVLESTGESYSSLVSSKLNL